MPPLLQKFDAGLPARADHFGRPYGGLHLADVGFLQEKHAEPALADAAAYGKRKLILQHSWLTSPLVTAKSRYRMSKADSPYFMRKPFRSGSLPALR